MDESLVVTRLKTRTVRMSKNTRNIVNRVERGTKLQRPAVYDSRYTTPDNSRIGQDSGGFQVSLVNPATEVVTLGLGPKLSREMVAYYLSGKALQTLVGIVPSKATVRVLDIPVPAPIQHGNGQSIDGHFYSVWDGRPALMLGVPYKKECDKTQATKTTKIASKSIGWTPMYGQRPVVLMPTVEFRTQQKTK